MQLENKAVILSNRSAKRQRLSWDEQKENIEIFAIDKVVQAIKVNFNTALNNESDIGRWVTGIWLGVVDAACLQAGLWKQNKH